MIKKWLGSRKFYAILVSIIGSLWAALSGDAMDPAVQAKMIDFFMVLAGVATGGIGIEDAMGKLKSNDITPVSIFNTAKEAAGKLNA